MCESTINSHSNYLWSPVPPFSSLTSIIFCIASKTPSFRGGLQWLTLKKQHFPLHSSLPSISYACNNWTQSFAGRVKAKSKPRMMTLSFAQHELDMLTGAHNMALDCRVRLGKILQFFLNFLFGNTQDARLHNYFPTDLFFLILAISVLFQMKYS